MDGFISSGCSANRNGEKDWENESTTSSVASATEYTGRILGNIFTAFYFHLLNNHVNVQRIVESEHHRIGCLT